MSDRAELQSELATIRKSMATNVWISERIEAAYGRVRVVCAVPESRNLSADWDRHLDSAFRALGSLLESIQDAYKELDEKREELECEIESIGEMSDEENAEYENRWMDKQR